LRLQLAEHDMKLQITQAARLAIAEAGFDPDYGARPLRRVIQNRIQDPMSEMLLANRFAPGDTIEVDFREVEEDGKKVKDFAFDVVNHQETVPDIKDPETVDAIAAMFQ
jgi:ATP-dependent Clp protease ATP-binding subunit ClpA